MRKFISFCLLFLILTSCKKANEVSDGDCIPEMRQVVDIGSYPGKFTLLASAILALSGGKTSVPVDFDKCRRLLETQDQLRTGNLDRSTYAELIEAACAEGYAKEGGLTDERWVMLVGREVSPPSCLK